MRLIDSLTLRQKTSIGFLSSARLGATDESFKQVVLLGIRTLRLLFDTFDIDFYYVTNYFFIFLKMVEDI